MPLPENAVGVDDYSRFRIIDGETIAIEFYPRPWRHPLLALNFAVEVLLWHIDMVRHFGWGVWNKSRKL